MARSGLAGTRIVLVVVTVLLSGLLTSCSNPGTSPAATSQADEMAALKQQVALQETSVAVLNSLNQQVVAQQTTIAVLAPLKEQVAVQATRITLLN